MLKYIDGKTVITYEIISSTVENRTVYGFKIEARASDGKISAEEVSDVVFSESEARKLLGVLAANGAYPCHLPDIAQDYAAARR